MILLHFIDWIYRGFTYLLTGWGIGHFIAFLTIFPIAVLALQTALYGRYYRYAKAKRKLAKFLKRNSFVTSRNIWSFNKKVVSVFPKYLKNQAKHIAQADLPLDNLADIFKGDLAVKRKNIVRTGYLIHILSLGVIMFANGFEVSQVAFAAIGMTFVWIGAGVADMVIAALFCRVDRRSAKKFLFALERNIALDVDEIDLSIPEKLYETGDSVSDLAKSVEEFLATDPDKGIAKVVLKSLYSSAFSGAMKAESAMRLKNVMQELKNYVG